MIRRGEVYLYDGDPVVGNEQGGSTGCNPRWSRGRRPGVVVSGDPFNEIAGRHIVLIVPLTRRTRHWSTHVPIKAGTAGLDTASYAMTEQVRAVSPHRLGRKLGVVDTVTLASIGEALRGIFALD